RPLYPVFIVLNIVEVMVLPNGAACDPVTAARGSSTPVPMELRTAARNRLARAGQIRLREAGPT
ncbi:MAG: hypothetical protein ACRD4Y_02365, partial [Candidatus Acidiferrales bacterium]